MMEGDFEMVQAIKSGDMNEVAALIARGVDNPMHVCEAVVKGDLPTVKTFLTAGITAERFRMHGRGILHFLMCSSKYRTETLTMLIGAGADVNMKDDEGHTPLHVSVFCESPEGVADLLFYGANKHIRNDDGAKPRDIACALNNLEISNLLDMGRLRAN